MEETVIDVRLKMWMGTANRYRQTDTTEGVKKTGQLDHTQRQGLKSLEEKVKKGIVHIRPSDKGYDKHLSIQEIR